ncbi:MAG: hypothetical protein P8J79_13315 [Halioglobus sp.]|nr:hypothetical protein [Halioglobus sp.]
MSINEPFLELAGTSKSSNNMTIDDFPWKAFKQESDAADILAKSGDVKEAVGLYFHPARLEWVQFVTVKFSYQSSSASGQPLKWGGQPVIYILMMDVNSLSRRLSKFSVWSDRIRIDYKKNRVFLSAGTSVSRNDLICLSYYLENTSQSVIANIMNQSIKTVEKRISNLKVTLLKFDPSCDSLHSLCRKHGLTQMFEMKRDWFDRNPVAWKIANMQWQLFRDWIVM